MAEAEKLKVEDAESAQKAILDLVQQYPHFPKTFAADNKNVRWNRLTDSSSIGIFPLQGAIYLKKYVSGSYKAQMPYQMVFRSSPTTNKASIDAQTVLENLSKWLEQSDIAFKEQNMVLESINRTSPVYLSGQDEKKIDYAVNMQLKYFYRK